VFAIKEVGSFQAAVNKENLNPVPATVFYKIPLTQ
jgi:hypothetical protein